MDKWKIFLAFSFILTLVISGMGISPQVANAYPTLSDGWYRIQPMHDLRRSIDALGPQVSYQGGRGNNLHMWDTLDVPQQKFYLKKNKDGSFSLRSGYGNGYVTVHNKGNGANLYVMPWSERNIDASRSFYLLSAGNSSYHIMSKLGLNLNFDCEGAQKRNGANVQLWTKENNSLHHRWRFVRVRN